MSEGLRSFQTRGGLPSNLPEQRPDLLKRYGLALALACVALLLRSLLPVREGTTVYQLPLVAVVLAGWYGGRGPGLFVSLGAAAVALVDDPHLTPASRALVGARVAQARMLLQSLRVEAHRLGFVPAGELATWLDDVAPSTEANAAGAAGVAPSAAPA